MIIAKKVDGEYKLLLPHRKEELKMLRNAITHSANENGNAFCFLFETMVK